MSYLYPARRHGVRGCLVACLVVPLLLGGCSAEVPTRDPAPRPTATSTAVSSGTQIATLYREYLVQPGETANAIAARELGAEDLRPTIIDPRTGKPPDDSIVGGPGAPAAGRRRRYVGDTNRHPPGIRRRTLRVRLSYRHCRTGLAVQRIYSPTCWYLCSGWSS